MSKDAIVTAETEIGKKKSRSPKEIPYDELKTAALSLPINIRAALATELKASVLIENEKKQKEAKELQSLAESLK